MIAMIVVTIVQNGPEVSVGLPPFASKKEGPPYPYKVKKIPKNVQKRGKNVKNAKSG
jgi:hypothetical protein